MAANRVGRANRVNGPTEPKEPPYAPDSFLVREMEKLPSFYQNIFCNVLDEAREFLGSSRSTSLYVGLATHNTPSEGLKMRRMKKSRMARMKSMMKKGGIEMGLFPTAGFLLQLRQRVKAQILVLNLEEKL